MTTKDHAQLLAAAHGANAALTLMAGAFIAIFGAAGFAMTGAAMKDNPSAEQLPPEALPAIGSMFVLIFGLVGCLLVVQLALSLAAAIGVWKRESWGRIAAIIAAVLAVMSFPLGTALGVYTFWFVFGDRGKEWWLER